MGRIIISAISFMIATWAFVVDKGNIATLIGMMIVGYIFGNWAAPCECEKKAKKKFKGFKVFDKQ